MASPITFGGFNNIDFGVVLNAIMQQERAPLSAIETQRTALQAQNTAFAAFATRLGALETAVAALAESDSLSKVAATSSDDKAVGISAGSASVTGRYEIVVSELARSQVTPSQTTYTSLDAVIATSGVVGLAQFSQPPLNIQITGATTLEDLAAAINEQPDSPVSAAVVQVTPGQYRLVLTGRSTGAEQGFTVSTTALAGGEGLAFLDTDGNDISGDTEADNVQTATNALATVNQVPISSASNTLQDVIPGVTLNLKKKDPDTTVTIDVAQDQADTVVKVEAFATAYNNVIAFMNEQKGSNGAPGISRDALVRGLRDALRGTILGAEGGVLSRLPEVGIGFDISGKIKIEKDVLTNALQTSSVNVQQLFGGADGDGGRFGALKKLITGYTEAGGLVANVRERIDTQVSRLGARLVTLESQLALRRAALQQEFIAADRAMSQLNSQGNSLGQLGGQFRLF